MAAPPIYVDGSAPPIFADPPFALNASDVPNLPGLRLIEDFITPEEEIGLLAHIDAQPWNRELSRQTQHYGYRYVYATRQLEPAAALPPWLVELGQRIATHLGLKDAWTQVIVNEYQPGQGIASHTDHTGLFGPVVGRDALGAATVMEFSRGSSPKRELWLQRPMVRRASPSARVVGLIG